MAFSTNETVDDICYLIENESQQGTFTVTAEVHNENESLRDISNLPSEVEALFESQLMNLIDVDVSNIENSVLNTRKTATKQCCHT